MLNGYKTYLAAIAALLLAIAGIINEWIAGTQIHYELFVTAFIALAILFLRKSEKEKV